MIFVYLLAASFNSSLALFSFGGISRAILLLLDRKIASSQRVGSGYRLGYL